MFDATSSAKDAAQTTIPYIDSQEVAPSAGVWFTGVGLYHKGRIGYGGFVGFLVKTLDFSNHLLPDYQNDGGRRSDSVENERLILREVMKYDFSAHQNL